jgi:hypothetical protein
LKPEEEGEGIVKSVKMLKRETEESLPEERSS